MSRMTYPGALVAGAALAAMVAAPAAAEVLYSVKDLGTLGGISSTATDINNSGQIVGYYQVSVGGPMHAFLYSGSSLLDLNPVVNPGSPVAGGSGAVAINDAGQIVGRTDGSSSYFLYQNGSVRSVPLPTIYDINTNGVVAGASSFYARTLYDTRTNQYVGYQEFSTRTTALNDSNQATGVTFQQHAFFYDPSSASVRDIGTLGGARSSGADINNSGWVTGTSETAVRNPLWPGMPSVHAFVYNGSTMKDLGTLGGLDTYGLGINARGEVVGTTYDGRNDSYVHAFLYDGSAMFDLNDHLAGGNAGLTLVYADAINNAGQIVGWGTTANGTLHSFLATPVPEPATCTLMLMGLGAVGFAAKRRKTPQNAAKRRRG